MGKYILSESASIPGPHIHCYRMTEDVAMVFILNDVTESGCFSSRYKKSITEIETRLNNFGASLGFEQN
jgi:hypothetical protein